MVIVSEGSKWSSWENYPQNKNKVDRLECNNIWAWWIQGECEGGTVMEGRSTSIES